MSEKQSFWRSIPDVLKYIAGILGGIAAVFFALQQLGVFNDADKSPPKIVSFEAARTTISLGQSTTLIWVVNEADSVTINGETVNATGTKSVSPRATTAYVLAASNQNASEAKTRIVTVTEPAPPVPRPPEIIHFDASNTRINSGQSVTLSWRVKDAVQVKLDGQNIDHRGTKRVTPKSTKTYQLIAYNKDGSDQEALTVTVIEPTHSPDEKEAALTKRALDAPKNNAWHGELVIFDPKTHKELAKGGLMFGPTTYKNNIAYARISLDKSSITGLKGAVEGTESVWGFMGAATDSSISIVFGNNRNKPVLVFNKLTKDRTNGFLELRGVLFMQQQGKNNVVAHARASCRAR